MQTKFVQHADKNLNPTQVWNIPFDETNDLARKIEDANRARANNKPPIVVNEYVNATDI